ncbi:MAG: hypothetical protein WCK42_04460 [Myxococcaceae bacterium]
MKKYLLFLILSSPLSAQSPLYAVPVIAAAALSFGLGTNLGSDSYLKCPDGDRKFSCCHRIFNTTLAKIIDGPCSNLPQCSNNTSVTCITHSSAQTTPQIGASPGLVGGIIPAIVFWIAAHGLIANSWGVNSEYEILSDHGDNDNTCFESAQCTRQGKQVFIRYFVTTFVLSLDLMGIISAFTGFASPKKATCTEGMTCCDSSGCDTSLSALKPTCNMGTNLKCVSGKSLIDPDYKFTLTSLALGVTTSAMLGVSAVFGLLSYLQHQITFDEPLYISI